MTENSRPEPHIWDSIVIGGGAAGLSAAQALGRSLRSTLIVDAAAPRNRFAQHMHNVLGHDGISPSDLLARGREEAAAYGVAFREAVVRAVRDGSGSGPQRTVELELADGEKLAARTLVVATGVTDALPPVAGLAEYWGSSVLHCPYCHGWEVRGQRLAALTTSPLSLHQAKLLRQLSGDVIVFSSGLGELDADTERSFEARGVRVEPDPVVEVLGNGHRVTSVRTEPGHEFEVDAVFTAGEMVPHDGFLAELTLARRDTPFGSFIVADETGRTSHPRVWAAGNVVVPPATVPMAMGAGTLAGASANAALVDEDFALAVETRGGLHGRPDA